jgi:hypothetical protein
MWWYRIGAVILTAGVVSFPWWHSHPVATDMALHTAIAKAFLELVAGDAHSSFPYELTLRIGPYQIGQLLLAALVGVLGPLSAAKSALSLYSFLTILSVGYLVGRVNPSATWERLVGVPFALNYFFHWGFWPFLISLPVAYFTIGYALRESHSARVILTGSLLRLLAFLSHPITAIAIGLSDLFVVLLDVRSDERWRRPTQWRWGTMVGYWFATGVFAVVSILYSESTGRATAWGSFSEQAIQLMRPLYVTQHWWEGLIPFAGWAILALMVVFAGLRRRVWPGIWFAGAALILFGLVFPRAALQGSWEQGARFVLIGMVVIASSWANHGLRLRRIVLLWILAATAVNLTVGHLMWHRHSQSMEKLLSVTSQQTSESVISTSITRTDDQPSVDFGRHAGVWAWCLGIAGDAYNDVAGSFSLSIVRYRRPDSQAAAGRETPHLNLIYHPYDIPPDLSSGDRDRLLYQDSIYTMYRIE